MLHLLSMEETREGGKESVDALAASVFRESAEHFLLNEELPFQGSFSYIKNAVMAELADAPDLGSGGQPWGFESP